MQKTILAILFAGLSILATAQSDYEITYPYNPDADSDGFISTPDLLEFLGFYGYPFMLGEIYVDGESLGDVMVNLQALFESNFEAGNENGDFLRWDSALESWVPHSILSEVQIQNVEFLDDVVVMTGAQISNDLGVGGSLGAQSLIVQGTINASGTINGRDLAADGSKLDGIESGAQVNVQADWAASSGNAAILNKPTTITADQSIKLEGIETGAQQTNAERVDDAGAVMTTDNYIRILSDLGKEANTSEEIISKYNFEDPDNYPMVIQGGDHGILISIQDKPWDKDWNDYMDNGVPREFKQQAPSSAHKFISFASGRPYDGPGSSVKNDQVTFIGSIKGNGPDNYNDLAAGVLLFPYSMYVHLANMMASANSGGQYIQSCVHTFEFKNNHGSSISFNTSNGELNVDYPGTFMWVGVERAQKFTFPGEYHADYYQSDEEQNAQAAAALAGDPPIAPKFEGFILGNSNGVLDGNGMEIVSTISDAAYEDLVDVNGNCRSADCWGWIKLYPRDEPYEIIIPEIHDVKLRFVTDQGLTANPNFGGDNYFDYTHPANDNIIRWTNPYEEIQVGADVVLMTQELSPFEQDAGLAVGSPWQYEGSWCPSPVDDTDSGEEELNSEAGTTQANATSNNYNGQITSYYSTTQPNPEHAEMYSYITQVLSVIDALKNGIMLMTAVIPPGLPFDAVDIPDMLVSFLLSLGNMVVTFGEAESTYGVTYGSGGADYAEYLPKYDPSEMFAYGEIVGVLNGQISKRFIEADHYMVVSKAPMILGNDPGDPEAEADFEKVAFMGQVPVKVKGDVESGDFILMTRWHRYRCVAGCHLACSTRVHCWCCMAVYSQRGRC